MKLAWVTTWDRQCGIADYSKHLWPALSLRLKEEKIELSLISLDEYKTEKQLLNVLERIRPNIVHFQHEYGLFGGKNPPFYYFPRFIKTLKKKLPEAFLVATAHQVLERGYFFPLKGKKWIELPFRYFANKFLIKYLKNLWNEDTWGMLDGIIVHSESQKAILHQCTDTSVVVIPHFVPSNTKMQIRERNSVKTILVFGFFSYDKGQDIAIRAMSKIKTKARLICAGAARRKQDQEYLDYCKFLSKKHGLEKIVEFTGYIAPEEIATWFEQADLVLAPFRETTGSGSLTHALSFGKPILASNLFLNKEIELRQPHALAFFESDDELSCAEQIDTILSSVKVQHELSDGAYAYAQKYSSQQIADQIIGFYKCLKSLHR